jgi:hypothetical protein
VPCASLDGLESDSLHHNLQVPYRGHLVLPWAPEYGVGGLSLFDMADPCAPTRVGDGTSDNLRETHAIGFAYLPPDDPHAGDWAVTNGKVYGGVDSGVLFWDLSDPSAPEPGALLTLPESWYPDSYTRVTLSVYWQYPWLYVASSDNGIFVVDATDPTAPVLVNQLSFGLRAGGVFALGNELLVTSAEQTQAAILDISDPANPSLLPGSPFGTVPCGGGRGRDLLSPPQEEDAKEGRDSRTSIHEAGLMSLSSPLPSPPPPPQPQCCINTTHARTARPT